PKALVSVTAIGWPGCHWSTSTPKTICVLYEMLIWLRGSPEGSVERRRRSRPSRGVALFSFAKETENLGVCAVAICAARKGRARNAIEMRVMMIEKRRMNEISTVRNGSKRRNDTANVR